MTVEVFNTNLAHPQLTQTDFAPYMPYLTIALSIMVILLAINSRRKWDKIAVPFRTDLKLGQGLDDDDLEVLHMGRWTFRRLVVIPTDQGLYISKWGFLNTLLSRRVLIPWKAFSNIYTKKRSVLGLSVEEHFVTVSATEKIEMHISLRIAKEIVQKNFLKQD